MRLMHRNKVTIYYCLYKSKTAILDEDGNETSEYRITYQKPVKLECNVSPATGYAQAAMFGNLDSYDKIIVTDDTSCPIDENTVLFVDKSPNSQGTPEYDYTVKRVAKSLNSISYAIRKRTVS